ncbi:MAG: (5-formylfuran-3-yl)methyl phosphate synthase [Hyphomicrobium sp.]
MIKGLMHGGSEFLASAISPEEARLALSGGASIIDCKDPSTGALGALPASTIEAIVEATGGRVLVSATTGDLPSDPAAMVKAAARIAATGVDIVKVGFFGDTGPSASLAALGAADIGKARLVAVLMADRRPDFAIIVELARAGFAGVMLDTADKLSGSLPDILDATSLAAFIDEAHAYGLAAGLAGSLRRQHIAALVALRPDIIGFRGALCDGGRTNALDAARVRAVRSEIDAALQAMLPLQRSVA